MFLWGAIKIQQVVQFQHWKDFFSILDGSYTHRVEPIAKCAVAALSLGYNMFAVQNGGQCFASATAPLTFSKYGKSTACWNGGEGGPWASQVYVIKGTA